MMKTHANLVNMLNRKMLEGKFLKQRPHGKSVT